MSITTLDDIKATHSKLGELIAALALQPDPVAAATFVLIPEA